MYLNCETPKIAETDIVCYKQFTYDGKRMVTQYQHYPMNIGCTYTDRKVAEIEGTSWHNQFYNKCPKYYLTEGVFHSFADFGDALTNVPFLRGLTIIVKCIIPKGAEYYEGVYPQNDNGKYTFVKVYGSKKIKLIEDCIY